MHQGHGLWSKSMNHLKDWDGHRDSETNTERDEKKRVLRQKTLSLESFLFESFLKSFALSTGQIANENVILEKTEKLKKKLCTA